MTHGTVWLSPARMRTGLTKYFTADVVENDEKKAVQTIKLDAKGIPSDPDNYPKKMWATYPESNMKLQQELFRAAGFLMVRSDMAQVLSDFNLGKTRLLPVELYQHDRVTPVEGSYFCLAFGEQCNCFLPEASLSAEVPDVPMPEPIWILGSADTDKGIALDRKALPEFDLFIDPKLMRTFFLSGSLVAALKDNNFSKLLSLAECRLVE